MSSLSIVAVSARSRQSELATRLGHLRLALAAAPPRAPSAAARLCAVVAEVARKRRQA